MLTRSENSNSRKSATSEKYGDMDDVEIVKNPISKAIEEHNIGFLKFSKESEKLIVTDALKKEIITLGSKYF